MKDAQTDLAGNISGRFSPEDWARILTRASASLEAQIHSGKPENEAWGDVIREFHRERYWGFQPSYRPPKVKKEPDLAIGLIVFLFISFTLVKMAVVWTGQLYTFSDEEADTRKFYAALILVAANVVFFLWRFRRHKD
jgi:hypothetical protein